MKSKKRHHSSSEESEASELSERSSSSESESDDSSVSEHRHKKKKKRGDSTESGSDSDDQKRSKKRKHKKKKKKHNKKKRRSESPLQSISAEDVSSASEGEITKKRKKHKHKHSKRTRDSSANEEEAQVERRLHSVVKERRATSEEGSHPPPHTYYQREKEYHHTAPTEEYDREREVQRFYRGSSKERRAQYQEQYQHDRNHKYSTYQHDRNDRQKFGHNTQYNQSDRDYGQGRRDFVDPKRPQQRYVHQEGYNRKQREEPFHSREDPRAHNSNRYNQYEERGPKRREFDDSRDFRRGPPPPDRFREREYPEKRERYQERFSDDRAPNVRRERPSRPDKPPAPPPPPQNNEPRPRSEDGNYRDRSRKPEESREGREERHRDRGEQRRERVGRSGDRERPASSDTKETRPRERKSRFGDADENKEYSWGKTEAKKEGTGPDEIEKPNFGLSGKLTEHSNTVNGVVIKYTEPDDAKQPKRRWRFYPFKGDKPLPILYIHRQSAFLIGRDKKVADIHLEHPSISKQHSALQYRATPFTRADGSQGRRVRPYIIDLDSANGTFVNNKKIEPRRYVELLERDVVKFGFSQREYVLLHENSKDEAQDDDHEPALGASVTTADQIKQEKRAKMERHEDGE